MFFQWQQNIYVLTAQHEMTALALDRFRPNFSSYFLQILKKVVSIIIHTG